MSKVNTWNLEDANISKDKIEKNLRDTNRQIESDIYNIVKYIENYDPLLILKTISIYTKEIVDLNQERPEIQANIYGLMQFLIKWVITKNNDIKEYKEIDSFDRNKLKKLYSQLEIHSEKYFDNLILKEIENPKNRTPIQKIINNYIKPLPTKFEKLNDKVLELKCLLLPFANEISKTFDADLDSLIEATKIITYNGFKAMDLLDDEVERFAEKTEEKIRENRENGSSETDQELLQRIIKEENWEKWFNDIRYKSEGFDLFYANKLTTLSQHDIDLLSIEASSVNVEGFCHLDESVGFDNSLFIKIRNKSFIFDGRFAIDRLYQTIKKVVLNKNPDYKEYWETNELRKSSMLPFSILAGVFSKLGYTLKYKYKETEFTTLFDKDDDKVYLQVPRDKGYIIPLNPIKDIKSLNKAIDCYNLSVKDFFDIDDPIIVIVDDERQDEIVEKDNVFYVKLSYIVTLMDDFGKIVEFKKQVLKLENLTVAQEKEHDHEHDEKKEEQNNNEDIDDFDEDDLMDEIALEENDEELLENAQEIINDLEEVFSSEEYELDIEESLEEGVEEEDTFVELNTLDDLDNERNDSYEDDFDIDDLMDEIAEEEQADEILYKNGLSSSNDNIIENSTNISVKEEKPISSSFSFADALKNAAKGNNPVKKDNELSKEIHKELKEEKPREKSDSEEKIKVKSTPSFSFADALKNAASSKSNLSNDYKSDKISENNTTERINSNATLSFADILKKAENNNLIKDSKSRFEAESEIIIKKESISHQLDSKEFVNSLTEELNKIDEDDSDLDDYGIVQDSIEETDNIIQDEILQNEESTDLELQNIIEDNDPKESIEKEVITLDLNNYNAIKNKEIFESPTNTLEDLFPKRVYEIVALLGEEDSNFFNICKELNMDILSSIDLLLNKALEKQKSDKKEKMFTIPGYDLTLVIAQNNNDKLKIWERKTNLGAVMYSQGKERWNALILHYDINDNLISLNQVEVKKEDYDAVDWKFVVSTVNKMKLK